MIKKSFVIIVICACIFICNALANTTGEIAETHNYLEVIDAFDRIMTRTPKQLTRETLQKEYEGELLQLLYMDGISVLFTSSDGLTTLCITTPNDVMNYSYADVINNQLATDIFETIKTYGTGYNVSEDDSLIWMGGSRIFIYNNEVHEVKHDEYVSYYPTVDSFIAAIKEENFPELVTEEDRIAIEWASYEKLQKGSKGEEVIALQNRLNELGYSVGTPDGDYGKKTESAIKDFQEKNGLEITGVCDTNTRIVLFSDEAQ